MIKISKIWVGLLLVCTVPSALASGSCSNENMAIPFSTPNSDFTVQGDGTVTHNPTGLMWMRCGLGQSWNGESCSGSASRFSWQDALAQNGTNYAGYADWRLPNKNELASIIELRCWLPTINNAMFPDTPRTGLFWSSSPEVNGIKSAWGVRFIDGTVDVGKIDFNYTGHVRLVRAGK